MGETAHSALYSLTGQALALEGVSLCSGTPYHRASRAWMFHGRSSPQFRSAAKLELNFLISLLPKKPKTKNTK